jgi:hypothetical protein
MRLPKGFVKQTGQRLARVFKRDGGRRAHVAKRDSRRLRGVVKRDRAPRAASGSPPTGRFARAPSGSPASGRFARGPSGSPGSGRSARIAKLRHGRIALYINRDKVRFARTVVAALVLLLVGGTAGALALLPPEVTGGAAQRLGLASGAPAPSAIAEGDLGERAAPHRAGADYYRKTTTRHVAASVEGGFLPIYRKASAAFGVSWRLLASIHRQETAFSSVPSTYHGLNAFGCCAGPMQFNVTNGPPSTWARYRQSFRLGHRPHRYPHPTRHHPSIYDDFDAIMGAAALLRDSGASEALDIGSWEAAYSYYGHDTFGTHYASQVLGRAAGWERYGFCLNCPDDAALVAEFDDSYGVEARRELRAAERKHKKHKKKKSKQQLRAEAEQRREDRGEPPPASVPQDTTPALPTRTTTTPAPSTTTPTTTETTPAPAAAPPAVKTCTKLEKLLGCRDG